MTIKKKHWIHFIIPVIYLLLFGITILSSLPSLKEQQVVKIKDDLLYTGYDTYNGTQYIGSYYYTFTEDGLHFYLLNTRKETGIPSPKLVHGHYETCTKEVEELKDSIASATGFTKEEIDQLSSNCFFLEQVPLSLSKKIALILSIALALFSVIKIVLFLRR